MGHHLTLRPREKAATDLPLGIKEKVTTNLPLLGNNKVFEAITILEREGTGMRMNLVPALEEGGEA